MEEKEVFKQNLEETDTQGMLFPMQLLMKEYVKMPDEKKKGVINIAMTYEMIPTREVEEETAE